MKDRQDTAIYIAHDDHENYDPAMPERNLLRAILVNAMNDLKKSGDVARKAREFFLSTDENYLFSFQSICNHLDIDPTRVLIVTGILPRTKLTQEPSICNEPVATKIEAEKKPVR